MSDYIDAGDAITVSTGELMTQFADYMEDLYPGWSLNVPGLVTALAEMFADWVSIAAEEARTVPTAVFEAFGPVAGVYPLQPSPAVTILTVQAKAAMSGTIQAGTEFGLEGRAFSATETVAVPVGGSADVPLQAVLDGADGNLLSGTVELIDTLSGTEWIDPVLTVVTPPSYGGQDGELIDDYLPRLTDELQLRPTTLVLPRDFEIFGRSRVPEIHRLVAVDGYKPSDGTYNNPRCLGICAVDSAGEPLSSPLKTSTTALYQEHREINFIITMFDPTYTTMKVTYSVSKVGRILMSNADLVAACDAALTAYLSPARHGIPEGYGQDTELEVDNKVRISELYAVLNAVEGVKHVESLQIAKQADALGTVDVTLTGAVPLTRAGTIAGSVV